MFHEIRLGGVRSNTFKYEWGGVALFIGAHLIKSWGRAQSSIALSSGEAELYAATMGGTELLGAGTLARELGMGDLALQLYIDASATKGSVSRTGAGRLKHVETQHLWLQQHVKSGRITCTKIPRYDNTADMMTHAWKAADGEKFMGRMGFTTTGVEDIVMRVGTRGGAHTPRRSRCTYTAAAREVQRLTGSYSWELGWI